MEKDNKNAYSEVIEILKLIDNEEELEALPIEMLEVLKSKANPEYKPQISKDIPLDEQNLQPETLAILSWIAMKYWNEDIGEDIGENINNISNNNEVENKKAENQEIEGKKVENTDTETECKIKYNSTNIKSENEKNIINGDELKEKANIDLKNNEDDSNLSMNFNLPIMHQDLKWYQKIRDKIIEIFNKIFRKGKVNSKDK